MKNTLQKPHFIFWILIPVILLTGIIDPIKTLDINIYDTYYVIGLINLAVMISIIFGILGFGYWLVIRLNRKLVNWLTIIHLIITVIGFFIIMLIPYFSSDLHQNNTSTYFDLQVLATLSLIMVVFIQIIYLINVSVALVRKAK